MKLWALALLVLASQTSSAQPAPEGEFSPQALRQGVAQGRTHEDCASMVPAVIQSMQACAAYRAAERNECEPLAPIAARNLCFGAVRSRTAESCEDSNAIGLRARICAGVRSAERDKNCNLLSGYAFVVCGAFLR